MSLVSCSQADLPRLFGGAFPYAAILISIGAQVSLADLRVPQVLAGDFLVVGLRARRRVQDL